MFKALSAAAILAANCGWAAPQDCNPAEAEAVLDHALEAGVVKNFSMHNGLPTVAAAHDVWAAMDLETRLGIIHTFECAVAGSGNILAEIQVIAETGKVLASFDGISRKLEVKD